MNQHQDFNAVSGLLLLIILIFAPGFFFGFMGITLGLFILAILSCVIWYVTTDFIINTKKSLISIKDYVCAPENPHARKFLMFAAAWVIGLVITRLVDLNWLYMIIFFSPAVYGAWKYISKCFKDYDEKFGK